MDMRKMIFSVINWIYKDWGRRIFCFLWSVCTIAVILMSFNTIAYAVDSTSGASNQEHTLIVKNWKDEYIGTSNHVVMDPSTGNIIFIIVSLDQGENKEIAVPAGLFSVDPEHGALVLNISKKQLGSSPAYHASDLEDPEFFKKVYRFFAIAPPWTEETQKEENGSLFRF